MDPPELREGRGELEAAAAHAAAVAGAVRDPWRPALSHRGLRRTQHDRGDGAGAREQGYEYLAITDHSASHGFGDHVSPDALARQIERVRALDAKLEDFTLLAGSEVNILPMARSTTPTSCSSSSTGRWLDPYRLLPGQRKMTTE